MQSAAEARGRAQSRLRWELLLNLVRKDLKVKYKNSALGFLWSLANPLLYLLVYSIVFGLILKNGIPDFWIFLMSGLLVWNFFSGAAMQATGAVVGNANLVKKVRFPQSVLPLSSVGFAGFHFVLQLAVLFAAMLVARYPITWSVLMIVPAVVVATLFTTALCVLVSAVNVRYRDVEHLLEVLLLAWFWLTPIVYTPVQVAAPLLRRHLFELYLANPMTSVVLAFQWAVYHRISTIEPTGPRRLLLSDNPMFYLEHLAIGAGVSLVVLGIGIWAFRSLQADFAEEL